MTEQANERTNERASKQENDVEKDGYRANAESVKNRKRKRF